MGFLGAQHLQLTQHRAWGVRACPQERWDAGNVGWEGSREGTGGSLLLRPAQRRRRRPPSQPSSLLLIAPTPASRPHLGCLQPYAAGAAGQHHVQVG